MIRIRRPVSAPSPLTTTGARLRDELVAALEGDRDGSSGDAIPAFDASVYAHKKVKTALIAMQAGKCFLCESSVTHVAHGDVEHFRPKAAVRPDRDAPLESPGYYWLAYDWDNLFLACQKCNQSFKRNLFPLLNPDERARSSSDPIERERPVFIDPAREDPAELIGFRAEVPYAIDGNERASKTIAWLGLDRDPLNAERSRRYRALEHVYAIAYRLQTVDEETRHRAQQYLQEAAADDAPFALMIQCAIRAGFTVGASE